MNLQQKQVNENYEVFKKLLPNIINVHKDEYALMRNKKIIECFSTMKDAILAGNLMYKNKLFSVQEVTNNPTYIL